MLGEVSLASFLNHLKHRRGISRQVITESHSFLPFQSVPGSRRVCVTSLRLNPGGFPSRDMKIRGSTPPSKAESLANCASGSGASPRQNTKCFRFSYWATHSRRKAQVELRASFPTSPIRERTSLRSGRVSQLPGWEVCSRLPGLMRYGPSICTANRTGQTTVPLTPGIPFSGRDISRILGEAGISQRKLCVPRPGCHSALPGNAGRRKGNVWTNYLLRKRSNRCRNCAPHSGWKGGAVRGDRR